MSTKDLYRIFSILTVHFSLTVDTTWSVSPEATMVGVAVAGRPADSSVMEASLPGTVFRRSPKKEGLIK